MKNIKNRFKKFLKKIFSVLNMPEMLTLPGHLAFFFVLSIVPMITLIAYGASFLNISSSFIENFMTKAFSKDVAILITPMISNVKFDLNLIIFLCIAFYIASNGAGAIIVASNAIYGVKNSGYIKRKYKAIFLTFLMVLLLLFLLLIPAFGNSIVNILNYVNINENITMKISWVIKILKGPISWLFVFLIIKTIYKLAPEKKVTLNVNYGALFTTILWTIVTAIYSFYSTHYANYKVLYAGLSNVVILILWLYFLALIFVWGMALNVKEENTKLEKTSQIKKENT